ncbi:peptide chain release factor 1, mitochondrial [Anoplopoma fimbria]|uniref:peptide chain release factor 1, mitochondrial n=1 Tax=Anoplopoma fimbria TaxID=229290 RepID=UPI0023EBA44D|nr:peptide chain release factor 1, mitochondrial [Anoplopoma fimbria]
MPRGVELPEVGDGDDDEQVEGHGEQRDGGQQGVEQSSLRAGFRQPPAGGVEVWKAEQRTLDERPQKEPNSASSSIMRSRRAELYISLKAQDHQTTMFYHIWDQKIGLVPWWFRGVSLKSHLKGVQLHAVDLRASTSSYIPITCILSSAGTKDEDEQFTRLLKEEEAHISSEILALRKDMVKALVPTDPLDSSDVLLEVVSGRTTGGDICQQFTKEMFDMYQGFAFYNNWDFELLNYTPADFGGLHHAAVRIAGDNVYRHLKHEGGTHRVQRIPEVGLSSRMQRIHTGTMTVITLPQPVEFDVHIDPKDLRIDTFRSRGAGGQSVNTTDSAVRVVHLPTGITAECQQTRSQLQNRDTAMRVLRARLYQSRMGKETEQRHTARKQQVGTRSQSERIRTYNFSQDRVTDHRTGYVTRDIKEFMKGGEALHDLISDVLEQAEREALLEAVESSSGLKPPESGGQSAD